MASDTSFLSSHKNIVSVMMMKAAMVEKDYVIRIKEVNKPKPKPGQALVQIRAAAFNRRDFWITQKLYPGIKVCSV